MHISMIVAVAKNGIIGNNNALPWQLSDDLKLFKKRTSHHSIVMGRKTYDSIGKPLPNRRNIVISRNSDLIIDGCEIVNSLEKALEITANEAEVFVIGGEKIFDLTKNIATKLYLTVVDAEPIGDAYFDYQGFLIWDILSEANFEKSEKNEFDFTVLELQIPENSNP